MEYNLLSSVLTPTCRVQYPPLLPAVATGTIEDRSIVEPVRRIIRSKVHFLWATSVLICRSRVV